MSENRYSFLNAKPKFTNFYSSISKNETGEIFVGGKVFAVGFYVKSSYLLIITLNKDHVKKFKYSMNYFTIKFLFKGSQKWKIIKSYEVYRVNKQHN